MIIPKLSFFFGFLTFCNCFKSKKLNSSAGSIKSSTLSQSVCSASIGSLKSERGRFTNRSTALSGNFQTDNSQKNSQFYGNKDITSPGFYHFTLFVVNINKV
jgi:hypothetical protein